MRNGHIGVPGRESQGVGCGTREGWGGLEGHIRDRGFCPERRALGDFTQESHQVGIGEHCQAALLNCAMREDKFHWEEITSTELPDILPLDTVLSANSGPSGSHCHMNLQILVAICRLWWVQQAEDLALHLFKVALLPEWLSFVSSGIVPWTHWIF